jgi:tetratricopeptide (TPR) repeat protein
MSDAEVICSWGLTARGCYAPAQDAAARALRLAQATGHIGGQARALVAMAVGAGEAGRLAQAADHLARALALARQLGNSRYEATVLQFIGIVHGRSGDLDAAVPALEDSLAISRRYGDHYAQALSLIALAQAHLHRDSAQAGVLAGTALRIACEYKFGHHAADAYGVLGQVALLEDRRADALSALAESVRLWRTRGWPSFLAGALASLADAQDGDQPEAAREARLEARMIFANLRNQARVAELDALLAGAGGAGRPRAPLPAMG